MSYIVYAANNTIRVHTHHLPAVLFVALPIVCSNFTATVGSTLKIARDAAERLIRSVPVCTDFGGKQDAAEKRRKGHVMPVQSRCPALLPCTVYRCSTPPPRQLQHLYFYNFTLKPYMCFSSALPFSIFIKIFYSSHDSSFAALIGGVHAPRPAICSDQRGRRSWKRQIHMSTAR